MVQSFNPNAKVSDTQSKATENTNMAELKVKIRHKMDEMSNPIKSGKLTKSRAQIFQSGGMERLFNKLPSQKEIKTSQDADKIAFCAQQLKQCFASMKEDVNALSFDEVKGKVDPKITENLDAKQTKLAFRAAGFSGDI